MRRYLEDLGRGEVRGGRVVGGGGWITGMLLATLLLVGGWGVLGPSMLALSKNMSKIFVLNIYLNLHIKDK